MTTPQGEAAELDLSSVPLRPASKREIQQLETALIIATIYRPEVIELIRDPLERATWVDSLAVAAAALAREKAGYTISQIAEELGRSETTIRAHLHGRTKAGKLVRETYELLARGKLRIMLPFLGGAPLSPEEIRELSEAKEKLKQLEEKLKTLEEENKRLRKQLEECVPPEDVEKKLEELREKLAGLEEENKKLREAVERLEEAQRKLEEIKALLGC